MKVFVYGTLKRGYGNNRACLDGARFIGEATSASPFGMRAAGFPVIWPDRFGHPVRGEVFEIGDEHRQACDQLEGHPNFYRRMRRRFVLDGGKKITAWVYIFQGPRNGGFAVAPNASGQLEWSR
jgi:gamma-glutamylcyclotransferase (GGCT)/AIG2-like uncharacterized protein YtfP